MNCCFGAFAKRKSKKQNNSFKLPYAGNISLSEKTKKRSFNVHRKQFGFLTWFVTSRRPVSRWTACARTARLTLQNTSHETLKRTACRNTTRPHCLHQSDLGASRRHRNNMTVQGLGSCRRWAGGALARRMKLLLTLLYYRHNSK